MDYRILPPDGIPEATVELPLSKSLSNRVLIINALCGTPDACQAIARCDDTDAMVAALSSSESTINIGAAGTAMRFLTAYFAVSEGREVTLDGSDRMRRRPIRPLVDALRSLGADIEYAGEEGFPPLKIKGRRLAGGDVSIPASVSSQYISALLMTAPAMERGLRLTLEGEIISKPYIKMTLGLMEQAGATAEMEGNIITVAPGGYTTPLAEPVEADWSAASYWYEIEALSSGFIALKGLRRDSLQGDRRVADIFDQLGVTTEWEGEQPGSIDLLANPDQAPRVAIDLTENPDVAQTVAVTCAMLGIPFTISGLESLRIKETDRIEALRIELLRVGVVLDIEGDRAISWDGVRRPVKELPAFDTYDDHRMAMALAPVALYIPGIIVRDIEVVSKSYPGFWDDLRAMGFDLRDAAEPFDITE